MNKLLKSKIKLERERERRDKNNNKMNEPFSLKSSSLFSYFFLCIVNKCVQKI